MAAIRNQELNQANHDDDDSLPPTVIYIQEKTLLCRWENKSNSNLDATTDDDLSTSSSLLSDDSADFAPSSSIKAECKSPPRAPKRSFSPPRSAEKYREASRQSGIDIESVPLVPISFRHSGGRHNKNKKSVPLMACTTSLGKLIGLQQEQNQQQPAGGVATAVFCVRREGCGSCRDNAIQLAQLAQQFSPNLNLFGIIKKSNFVNDKALREFYNDYFPFPIYQDEKWDTFQFLGNRKISIWKALTTMPQWAKKPEEGTRNILYGGEHFLQGGILLFDPTGQLRYVYYERYGDELDMEALKWAIRDCLQQPSPPKEQAEEPQQTSTKATRATVVNRAPRRPQRSTSTKRDAAAIRPMRRGSITV